MIEKVVTCDQPETLPLHVVLAARTSAEAMQLLHFLEAYPHFKETISPGTLQQLKDHVEQPLKDVLSMPIEELSLHVRAYNPIKRDGIHTIGELIDWTAAEVGGIRNFGERWLKEVRQKLYTKTGLLLKGDTLADLDL